jgi:predicted Zn-ribbon and HTH transcriptional regulator
MWGRIMKRINEILKSETLTKCPSCGFKYMDTGISSMLDLVPCPECKSPLNLESEEEFEVVYEEVSCQEFEV